MSLSIDTGLVDRARGGDLQALNSLLAQLQKPLYNLAIKMVGRREDAQDACQEILLKITTSLSSWRGDSAFMTWAWRIASNHLLNAITRSPAKAEVSWDELSEALENGQAYANRINFDETSMSPEDALDARRTALSCTQAMLMCLDSDARMAYVLDVIFGLESPQAAEIQGISAAAFRKRLSRARELVHGFMQQRCGLVSASAPCKCVRQVPAKKLAISRGLLPKGLAVSKDELDAAHEGMRQLIVMGDAAAVMRGAPEYAPPAAMLQGIRLVVEQSSFLRH
jgi:RNA polymerase sigma factor (sigma-70 family)